MVARIVEAVLTACAARPGWSLMTTSKVDDFRCSTTFCFSKSSVSVAAVRGGTRLVPGLEGFEGA